MISAQPIWPWQRLTPDRRPLATVALVLISLSGLLTGIVLRPLTQDLWPRSPQRSATIPLAKQPTATPTSTTNLAQSFYLGLRLSPGGEVHAGDTLTVTATAKLSSTKTPAQGVTCSVTITGAETLQVQQATQQTDANGEATWTIPIPNDAISGGYTVTVNGKWGQYGATWENNLEIRGGGGD
jgi:hypothetical protein